MKKQLLWGPINSGPKYSDDSTTHAQRYVAFHKMTGNSWGYGESNVLRYNVAGRERRSNLQRRGSTERRRRRELSWHMQLTDGGYTRMTLKGRSPRHREVGIIRQSFHGTSGIGQG